MKIAYLARKPIPSVNANSVQIVKMCEGFTRIGHEVTLFGHHGDAPAGTVFDRYGVKPSFDIDTYPHGSQLLRRWRFALRLRRDPHAKDADAFYGRDVLALAAVAWTGKPLIYEAHVLPHASLLRRIVLPWLFSRPNFSHLVCVTSTLAQVYRASFPALAGKPVVVAPNAAADLDLRSGACALAANPGRVQVGFVGRPFPGKGVEAIIEAARRLPHIDFHIIGADARDITWVFGEYPRNLIFHGYRQHAQLGQYLAHFDIAVAPYGARVFNATGVESASITSPLKLLEYMAMGLPVIVSDLPGVRDILDGDDVGLIVPPGDVDSFVAALRTLAGNPELRARMGAAARKRYEERHTVLARAKFVLAPLLEDAFRGNDAGRRPS